MNEVLTGAYLVVDFRELDSWRRARFVVCSILQLTRSSVHVNAPVSQAIDRLSIALLDNIARGYEREEGKLFFNDARRSIASLEQELRSAGRNGILNASDATRLVHELHAVKQSLQGAGQ